MPAKGQDMPTLASPRISLFLARLLGPIFVAIAVGVLVNGAVFRAIAEEGLRSHALIYLTGLFAITAGVAILLNHNVWVADWRVLITIFGWLFLIGGIMRILAMSMAQRVGESVIAHQRWPLAGAIVTLALGAFLTVMGYQDVWGGGERRPSHRVSAARSARPASRSGKRPRRKAGEARPPH